MDVTPFRTVETPVTEPRTSTEVNTGADGAVAPAGDVEPGLALYEDVKGHPYTAEYFDLRLLMHGGDIDGARDDIYMVDEYVQQQIKDNGLKNTTAAYREIMNKLGFQIGSFDNEQPLIRFRRVATAVRALNRMKSEHQTPELSNKKLKPSELDSILGGSRVR